MKSIFSGYLLVFLALILLAFTVQSAPDNCNYQDNSDATKCQICNWGYGLSRDRKKCWDNKASGYTPYCRLYAVDSTATSGYTCDQCYCEYGFINQKTICVPNDFFGVPGCHIYQQIGQCLECRWTWPSRFTITQIEAGPPVAAGDWTNYWQVDLGLTNNQKQCKQNSGQLKYCLQYKPGDTQCLTCQLRVPVYPSDNVDLKILPKRDLNPFTAPGAEDQYWCSQYYFINQELFSSKTGDTPCVNSGDAGNTYVKLVVPKQFLDRTDFVDNTVTITYNGVAGTVGVNGCFKQIANCDTSSGYDWTSWKAAVNAAGSSTSASYNVKCIKCAATYVLTNDGTKCQQNPLFCITVDATTPAAITPLWNCYTCKQYEFLFSDTAAVDPNPRKICKTIWQCRTQVTPAAGGNYERKCDTCNTYFRSDKATQRCQYNTQVPNAAPPTSFTYQDFQGCVKESPSATPAQCSQCDTTLGYQQNPSGSPQVCICNTGFTKYVATSFDPINSWYPYNALACVKNPTDQCIEFLDNSYCKRCLIRPQLTVLGTCEVEPADSAPNKILNCQASYNAITNHPICRQCEKGYGVLAGIFQKSISVGAAPNTKVYTPSDNGKCSNDADATLSQYYIADCIQYQVTTATPSITTVTVQSVQTQEVNVLGAALNGKLIKCQTCRPGYKPDTQAGVLSTACIQDSSYEYIPGTATLQADANGKGCDYYTLTGECACKSGRVPVFNDIQTRKQFCITTAIDNCIEYTLDAGPPIRVKCTKCLTNVVDATGASCTSTQATIVDANRPGTRDACYEDPYYDKNLKKSGWILNTYWDNDPADATKKRCLANDATHTIEHCAQFNAPVAPAAATCQYCRKGYGVFTTPNWVPDGNGKCSVADSSGTPVLKGVNCIIAGSQDGTTSVCFACQKQYIPKYGTWPVITYCDSVDDVNTLQTSPAGEIPTVHPACTAASSFTDASTATTETFYSCDTCQLPYIRVKVGVYQATGSPNTEADIFSCQLPTIDRCQTFSTDGKCTQCYWPFYLVQATSSSPQQCLPEGCVQALPSDISKCSACYTVPTAAATLNAFTYVTYFLNTQKQQCQRHTYVANCLQYSATADKCMKCDEANYYYYKSDDNTCQLCNPTTATQYWDTRGATPQCRVLTNCATMAATAPFKCATCSNTFCIVNSGLDSCQTCSNCQTWSVDSQNVKTCIQCAAATSAYLADLSDCLVDTNYQNCFQVDNGSPKKCVKCSDGNYLLSDGKCKAFTNVQVPAWAKLCMQFNVDSTATDLLNALCITCNSTFSIIVTQSPATVGTCFEGCAQLSAYNNKLCSRCYPGWGLDNIDASYGGYCRPDGSIKRDQLVTNVINPTALQLSAAENTNAVLNCYQYDRYVTTTGVKCVRCHPGYFIYNFKCMRNQGSCQSVGCNFLSVSKSGASAPFTYTQLASSEQQQCHYDFSANFFSTDIQIPGTFALTGCQINNATANQYFDFNSQTKKCDFYTNPIPATPNDGSGLPTGDTKLGTTGNDGGIAPPVPTPTPSSGSSSVTPTPSSTSTTSGSFLTVGLETVLIVIFGVLAYLA